ncbi:zinc-dependent metalloprotease [Bradymonas sediminis]|uniref:EcxA zinc-binding domain-containing protein n=1 Tax=Bradymonas sediminis TaxID=1548548 RepID=A0A2Z4FH61_9DELT|nr:zinc-dependent metalloprotease [Bradymonas sediminis]AWV88303.1 hypothetical protein DN745_02680 [Bradymonas sediminis]TDP77427.1 uncharacterized protein DUF4953 [Bradymonas sediminis]
MMKNTRKLAYFGVPLLLALAISAGCAQDVGDIDRTQPNAIKKTDLEGRWHYQRTVVDVPASDGFTFVGNTDHSGMKEIKWEIQENFLYGRRQTELIEGADNKAEEGEDYRGEAIAVYRIRSHFDIQRQYNPSTGEQTNVIVENSSDRPWYEREYMRVDWSQNLVTNYQLDFEAEATEPVPYYVQEEFDPVTGELVPNPDAPVFDYEKKGNKDELAYFDITNRIFARAGTFYYPGYGVIPLCWLRGAEFMECGAGEYTIRNSFKRIDPDHQYVPQPYKGKETEVFGYFTTERDVYTDKNGIREQNKKRYLNRHNLWVNWYDEDGNLIPVAERELRPIVYFVNRDMPDDIKPMTRTVADQWNKVFNDAVREAGYPLKADERTFILCENNPVREGDPAACGAPGHSPRIGDIRYSFMAYIPKFMDYGLLGLGPSNNDPETGEIISGMAYVYHWNNSAAERTAEMVQLLNGNINPQEYIDGVNLEEWVRQVNDPSSAPARTFDISPDESFVKNIAARNRGDLMPITEEELRIQEEQGFDAFITPRIDAMFHRGQLNGQRSAAKGKLAGLAGTYIEDLLINDEILLATGHQPGAPVTDQDLAAASVVRGGFAKHEMNRAKIREHFAEQRNMYLPEMTDDALMGLAKELQDAAPEEVYDIIRTSIYTSVFAHEVGHSLGLMHNFAGSEDAVNYFDDYWKIRDDGNVGPRMIDPITQDEIDQKIYNYAYSSIMDYAGRYTIDGLGVAKYDRAAILYGYAGKIEVFKDRGNVRAKTFEDWFESRADILSFGGFGPSAYHYTKFYEEMGPKLYEESNRMVVDVADLKTNSLGQPDWSTAVVDGVEYSRVPYVYCSHTSLNISDSCLTRDYGADSYERMKNMIDDLNTWYISRAFPRGSVGRSSWGYVAGNYGRIYGRLKSWNDVYGLYAEILPTIYQASIVEDFLTRPGTGWGGKTWAIKNAFNYLLQTILMPNAGQFEELEMADGTTLLTGAQRYVTKELDITQGRYYSSAWRGGARECGYFWWECFHHIGYYLDKIMAIEALTDTETNFVARSTPEDIREWEVGYANTFPNEILELNSAIMAQKWDKFAPYLDGDNVMFPDYTDPALPVHAKPVDPFATFTIQLYWQVLGQARFPDAYSRNFLDESRIFLVGTGSAPDIDPSRLVTLKDPWTGYTYGAGKMEHGSAQDGSGEAMINRANLLLSRSSMCDNTSSTPTTVDDCVPGLDSGQVIKATQGLKDYIELIKVVADLSPKMSYGNPYAP